MTRPTTYRRFRDTIDHDLARQAYASEGSIERAASLCGVCKATMALILDEAGVVRQRGNNWHGRGGSYRTRKGETT